MPVGSRRYEWAPHYRSSLLWAPCCERLHLRASRYRSLSLRVAAPVVDLSHSQSPPCKGQAVANHPCKGPGRGRPPSFFAAFAKKCSKNT
ncbi:hypothetical protein B296_00025912 [Ensete ventricosum]|uniref:Uncharacterized protein n=1 Tax=Ensete ventricosum TaxID=4639 RepID=A0A426X5R7_ENSVE|nr:hypothetical protein B296_00025912 [Ensete ventricosum]